MAPTRRRIAHPTRRHTKVLGLERPSDALILVFVSGNGFSAVAPPVGAKYDPMSEAAAAVDLQFERGKNGALPALPRHLYCLCRWI